MKKWQTPLFILGFLVLTGSVILATNYLSERFLTKSSDVAAKTPVAKCSGKYASHTATIQNDKITPRNTQASLCDNLVIINKDGQQRKIAFGKHNQHVIYDNVVEKLLHQGQSLTIELNQAGSFTFHDHIQEEVAGYFTVTK